jgi:hypothetical protein
MGGYQAEEGSLGQIDGLGCVFLELVLTLSGSQGE